MNIRGKIRASLLIGACVFISFYGCSRDDHDHPDLTTGEELFAYHCVECHGEKGTGKLFDGIPANIFSKKNPQEIITYLTTETNHDREMPVFSKMPLDEAQLITQHLMYLKFIYDPKTGRNPQQFLIEP